MNRRWTSLLTVAFVLMTGWFALLSTAFSDDKPTKRPVARSTSKTRAAKRKVKKRKRRVRRRRRRRRRRGPRTRYERVRVIQGNIAPKSVVHSGQGLFFAQNMMYRHTVTVYNRKGKLVKTISDRIRLKKYGVPNTKGWYKGSPVEVAFSHKGRYAWVSNYKIYGWGFWKRASDGCSRKRKYDPSFLYLIDTRKLTIESVIKVGSVPKYLAVSPNNRWVLVSNWCSGDISVIDTKTRKEVRRVNIGRFPRGIAIDPTSSTAYVAVMGWTRVAVVDMKTWKVKKYWKIGRGPRHINMDPKGKYIYVTLNSESRVAKVDAKPGKILRKVRTGSIPRSAVLSADGKSLFVVNYVSHTFAKVRTSDMKVLGYESTWKRPIGITYDDKKKQVWVACYSGAILVFQDK